MFTPFNIVRALALLLGLAPAPAALAHAALLRSEPAARVIVAKAPEVIRLQFNEAVAPLRFQFIDPKGQAVALARVTADNAAITVTPPPNSAGGLIF